MTDMWKKILDFARYEFLTKLQIIGKISDRIQQLIQVRIFEMLELEVTND